MPSLTFAHIAALKAVHEKRATITAGGWFHIDGDLVTGDERNEMDDLWREDHIDTHPEDGWPDSDARLVLTESGAQALRRHGYQAQAAL